MINFEITELNLLCCTSRAACIVYCLNNDSNNLKKIIDACLDNWREFKGVAFFDDADKIYDRELSEASKTDYVKLQDAEIDYPDFLTNKESWEKFTDAIWEENRE